MPPIMSRQQRWSLHEETWNSCQKCQYHKDRRNVCLGRGSVPCDLLVIGDAPDDTDDVYGLPFSGREGIWLDEVLAGTLPEGTTVLRTNLVGCLPTEGGSVLSRPGHDPIRVCKSRLEELISIASPRVIMCLGKLPETWVNPTLAGSVRVPQGVNIVYFAHPSNVIRAKQPQRGYLENLFAVQLQHVVAGLKEAKSVAHNPKGG